MKLKGEERGVHFNEFERCQRWECLADSEREMEREGGMVRERELERKR